MRNNVRSFDDGAHTLFKVNGIAAFLGKDDVTGYLGNSLKALSHRAWQGYALQTQDTIRKFDPTERLVGGMKAAIGLCVAEWSGSEDELPFHGQIFDAIDLAGSQAYNKLVEADGEFALVQLVDGRLVFLRDRLGVKPLYFAIGKDVIGVASETKALQEAGFPRIESVIPGAVYEATPAAYRMTRPRRLPSDILQVDFEDAAAEVTRLLTQSVERRVRGKSRVAISFSGGLDSSIVASVASSLADVKLITAAAKGSVDHFEASVAADRLGLPLHTVELREEEIASQLTRIRWLIETHDQMDSAIALAFHFSARLASQLQCDTLFLGQLADELFGGYSKYLQLYRSKGKRATRKAMSDDVKLAYQLNFERDDKATSPFVTNSLPYSSLPLVNYALRMPVEFKIDKERGVRKLLLRKAGEMLGVPTEILQKPKKAIQYSSGAQKIVSKLLP